MDTATAIFITQIPIAIAILVCAYIMNQIKKEIVKFLKHVQKSG